MKRFLNFRPLLFAFVSFMGGVFSCVSAMLENIVPVIFCAVIAGAALILLIIDLCNKKLFANFSQIMGTKRLLWPCFCVVVGFVIGVSSSAISFCVNNKVPFQNGTYACTAKVSEVINYVDSQTVLLKNVSVDGVGYSFNLKLSLNTDNITVGDELSFVATLYASKLVENGNINTYLLKNKIKYYGYIDAATLQVKDGTGNLLEIVKDTTKNILLENMSEQNAGFAYATLVGDKGLLSDAYYNVFKDAGLAHILAVSGLHVGFLVGAVLLLLNLFKMRKKYQFFVVAAVLLLYCVLCGFSPSIFRASVMSLCLMLGMVLGEQNDTLSNLSLAGLIVLFCQPLYLYDVGFLLSFGSVLGILLLTKQISNLLCKTKLPKTLCNMIAVTISATLGTLPSVFSFFGEISLISLLSNLVVLPLFSIMFVILLFCVAINIIFPLQFLLVVAEFFVNIVVNISAIFAKFQAIPTFTFDVLSGIMYYVIMFVASRFFLLKAKNKTIIAISMILALSPYMLYINLPATFKNANIVVCQKVDDSLFVATQNNQKILINVGEGKYDVSNTKDMLKQLKVYSLDYLLLFDYTDSMQNNVCNFANNFDIKNIVAFGNLQTSTKVGLATNLNSNKNLSFCAENSFLTQNNQVEILALYVNNIFKAASIKFDGLSVLKIENNLTANQITSNSKFFAGFDYCFAKTFNAAVKNIPANKFICQRATDTSNSLFVLPENSTWRHIAA